MTKQLITRCEWEVISGIDAHHNYVHKLRKKIAMTNSTIYKTVYDLEKRGFIIKEDGARRNKLIALTDKGKKLKEEVLKVKELLDSE